MCAVVVRPLATLLQEDERGWRVKGWSEGSKWRHLAKEGGYVNDGTSRRTKTTDEGLYRGKEVFVYTTTAVSVYLARCFYGILLVRIFRTTNPMGQPNWGHEFDFRPKREIVTIMSIDTRLKLLPLSNPRGFLEESEVNKRG